MPKGTKIDRRRGVSKGVRLQPNEVEQIERLTEASGATVSSWIRIAVLEKLARVAKH